MSSLHLGIMGQRLESILEVFSTLNDHLWLYMEGLEMCFQGVIKEQQLQKPLTGCDLHDTEVPSG